MDTFAEEIRRIGLMLCYEASIEDIHHTLAPADEGQFFLTYTAAKRFFDFSSVDGARERPVEDTTRTASARP